MSAAAGIGRPADPAPRLADLQHSLETHVLSKLEYLNAIGVALSQERDINRLLETILVAAKNLTRADGGTLYRLVDDRLHFEIMRNDSLAIAMGGTSGTAIPFYPIPLHDKDGNPNLTMIAAYVAINDRTVNIADAYTEEGFDFSGTRNFDKRTGYRSTSFLTVPMKNHEGEIIGVLQLLNAIDAGTGAVTVFSDEDRRLAESLASQAAIALTNRLLIQQLEVLFESLIELINTAIDDKSPYTGGHCKRVPTLTMMLAEAAHAAAEGPLASFRMTDKDRYELKIAGLLHDCGKITTPVHVVDKATKLQTIFDRIALVDTRFEVLKREAEAAMLRAVLAAREAGDASSEARAREDFAAKVRQYDDDREFLRRTNVGGERMSPEDQARVSRIAQYAWTGPKGVPERFLSRDEEANLNIPYGTLNPKEREIINHHIVATIKMLEALPWPRHLVNVPEYAGGHHERMDGKGYPRGLTRAQMSVQARIMGIADIFEALTAKDRPYKPGKTLSESIAILAKFKENGHIDPDLFDIFVKERVYLRYAREFLDPEQIDDVDAARVPGLPG
ncbi:MAG TPA: HD domain-containing phosphohydrolase [Usitatibacteraceae bacterium]|jgi:HD-GYP domain-containing protein (c-di-GMP phosphodiesterase class II)|nr:GAF domain-containing protein [Burkholderiales bacterium]HQY47344.1 HD domain-containing phosphohydrolase [Usitatibacteraceae bacterium]HRA22546.1 HD domain-containing phosphohydrolase [Usitatibacteraceae bacterium]